MTGNLSPSPRWRRLFLLCSLLLPAASCAAGAPAPFMVWNPARPGNLPPIVLQCDAARGTGFQYEKIAGLGEYDASPAGCMRAAVVYLREAIVRMTGRELPVRSQADLSAGIVLTTLAGAGEDVRRDPRVRAALCDNGRDAYNAVEAFYLRSEAKRLLLVANTPAGLAAGVVELLESVGYEVLGMGPNWTHVPDYQQRPLACMLERAGRPGYYLRGLLAYSGQERGVGTLYGRTAVHDGADEPVEVSYTRWRLGARLLGRSMDDFPGHALQAYHHTVIKQMRETGNFEGFLVPETLLGAFVDRPVASGENAGWLWVSTDPAGRPGAGKVFLSDGAAWQEQNLLEVGAKLDLSSAVVRQIVLEGMKTNAEAHFAARPDDPFIFGTESEDGTGYARIGELARHPHWYPEYLKAERVPFGRPYLLHGQFGIRQPLESWDPASPSDHVFAFNSWLLREFDKWIDTLPAEQRVTASGKSKKALVRCSFYSYGLHDVPPSFNPDPRCRVMIAGYPVHRGTGKWLQIAGALDDARAFQRLLPREPSGIYQILSVAYYGDYGPDAWPGVDSSAASIASAYRVIFKAGVRAITAETDFNFGKFGLSLYLTAKILWNPALTDAQLEALRDRWFRRAFGSGWQEMKAAYAAIMPQNYPVAGIGACGQIIHLIDAADARVDPRREPAAQRRIDDVKQYWYFYYLLATGRGTPASRELKELVWKGQMSYMTAMHMVVRRCFGLYSPAEAAGPEFNVGPAHFTPEETARWWREMLRAWPRVEAARFADATLRNGVPAKAVDLHDLVRVREFGPPDAPGFYYNAGAQAPPSFLTRADRPGQLIGFSQYWPYNPADAHYGVLDVGYTVECWNARTRAWERPAAGAEGIVRSKDVVVNGAACQAVDIRVPAPRAGVCRITVAGGGYLSQLAGPEIDWPKGLAAAPQGFTYAQPMGGLTQSPSYFYIPKGTKSLDLEVWDNYQAKHLILRTALPDAKDATPPRDVDIGARGVHRIPLRPGEDGTVAMISGNGFAFPVLYSVPMLWARSPGSLLVPRAIARADGLTILQPRP